MDFVIDVEALAGVAREHSDNKLKVGLVRVRPHDALAVHTHDHEDQLY
jgi:hypothetical protein